MYQIISLGELIESPELLLSEIDDLKKELLMIGRQLEDLEVENDRLEIKLELEDKAAKLTNCTDLSELTENLDRLLQIRMKKTSVRPSNNFDDFKATLTRIKNAVQVTSLTPTRPPRPSAPWKPRATKAPKLIPVAVETEYEKQQRNGVCMTESSSKLSVQATSVWKRGKGEEKKDAILLPLAELKLAAFRKDPKALNGTRIKNTRSHASISQLLTILVKPKSKLLKCN